MITVIIPNWNGRNLLEECLGSLERQTFRDFEIIVVDNGSTDGSKEFIRDRFPDVKIIEMKENTGFASACNAGIRESKGDLIVLLNNDANADEKWLEKMVSVFEKHPEIGFCASRILFKDDSGIIDSAGDEFSTWGFGYKRGHGEEDDARFNEETSVFSACAGAGVYRKEMFERIGYFDEDFFAYYEDIDLSWRAWATQYRCLYVPEAVVYHKEKATSGKDNDRYLYLVQRNQELVLAKSVPAEVLLVCLPAHFLFVIASFLWYFMRGKAGIFIRAKNDALKMIPKMLKKRKEIYMKAEK